MVYIPNANATPMTPLADPSDELICPANHEMTPSNETVNKVRTKSAAQYIQKNLFQFVELVDWRQQ